jgi:hypothetical protein
MVAPAAGNDKSVAAKAKQYAVLMFPRVPVEFIEI